MADRRFVVVASRLVQAEQNSEFAKRTVVFNENTTLKEVYDWLRCKSDDSIGSMLAGSTWWDASVQIYEDEATKEEHKLFGTKDPNESLSEAF